MLKIIRFALFLLLVSMLFGLIYFVLQNDQSDQQVNIGIDEMDLVQRYQDSMNSVPKAIEESNSLEISTKIEDFEAKIENHVNKIVFRVLKTNHVIFEKEYAGMTCKQILSSDLNGNMQPEFWILVKKGKNSQFYAFEYGNGKLKAFSFPVLKGRQNFGYAGNDSLHVDKSYIVRSFKFSNDPYSDLSKGIRACYYSFGLDRSFVLNKTLDLEQIQK